MTQVKNVIQQQKISTCFDDEAIFRGLRDRRLLPRTLAAKRFDTGFAKIAQVSSKIGLVS